METIRHLIANSLIYWTQDAIGSLTLLQELNLFGCSSFISLPVMHRASVAACDSLLPCSAAKLGSDSFSNDRAFLEVHKCSRMGLLQESIGELAMLQSISLSGCTRLTALLVNVEPMVHE